MLELRDITLRFHPDADPVLDAVTLRVPAGSCVALVGRNGSGKSTLARVAAGLERPDRGQVTSPPGVGLLLQDPLAQIVGATVEEDVAFGLESQAMPRVLMLPRVEEALNAYALQPVRTRVPHTLSGGQQQRVALAGVHALECEAFVLDEPASHLDEAHRRALHEVVRGLVQRGAAVLWVTQHMDELVLCDEVVVLDAGRVSFTGSPQQLIDDEPLLLAAGLEPPPAARFARRLRARGVPVGRLPLDDAQLERLLAGPARGAGA